MKVATTWKGRWRYLQRGIWALFPLSRFPAADNFLSSCPFLQQLPLHVVTTLYKAKIKPRAEDGLKVGEDICVIWNDATFQLFQINGLTLLVQHWSSCGLIKGDRKSGKKWKLRDGVKDLHLPGSRHWLWDVQCGTSPCEHYHPTIIPVWALSSWAKDIHQINILKGGSR